MTWTLTEASSFPKKCDMRSASNRGNIVFIPAGEGCTRIENASV